MVDIWHGVQPRPEEKVDTSVILFLCKQCRDVRVFAVLKIT